jgi:hypothetical protein
MSRYQDLQTAYAEASASKAAYWASLRGTLQELVDGFRQYLGIEADEEVKGNDGSSTPILSIGLLEGERNFRNYSIDRLPHRDGRIEFALRLAFGSDQRGEIPGSLEVKLSIKKEVEPDVYSVQVHYGYDFPSFRGPSFITLYEYLTNAALESISSIK